MHPRDQIDAGRDHRRGVNERAHRRGAGHGVRQPDIERDLGRLAGRADKEEQADHRHRRHGQH